MTTTQRHPRRVAVSTETSEATDASMPQMVPKSDEIKQHLVDALRAHPLFEHLALPLMHKCIDATTEVSYSAGDEVIREGDAGDQFYVVYAGNFEAYHDAGSSKNPSNGGAVADGSTGTDAGQPTSKGAGSGEYLLQLYGYGEVFGELALLYNAPRACSVRATSESKAFALDRISFRQLVMQHNSGVKHGLEKYLRTVPLLTDLQVRIIGQTQDHQEAALSPGPGGFSSSPPLSSRLTVCRSCAGVTNGRTARFPRSLTS